MMYFYDMLRIATIAAVLSIVYVISGYNVNAENKLFDIKLSYVSLCVTPITLHSTLIIHHSRGHMQ